MFNPFLNRVFTRLRGQPLTLAFLLCGSLLCFPAEAQTVNDALSAKLNQQGKDRLLLEASELVYDNDKNTVSAVGDVEMNYQGRTLQADRVIYDRASKRVTALGNARLTEADGTVSTGDRFELTDDFRNGFINSLRVETKDKTHFASPRAERTDGETVVFDKGVYTACDACKDHPERPPLWQVKAARIVHNNSERMIYYEDATLEFGGIPVGWVPYFSSPDPTVKRKSGFLAPRYVAASSLGFGASIPYFWAIAPSYDLTLTPTILSRQGVLGQAEWRQRFATGAYTIRASGINQADKGAFLLGPLGAGDKEFRGSLETTGTFNINDKWRWGWDLAGATDKWFLQNYRIRSESLSSTYFRESTSQVYLTGEGDRSFFDARGYYFRTLTYTDWQKQQPVVAPVVDYDRRFKGPDALGGGEVTVNVNATSLSREAAQFQGTGKTTQYLFTSPAIGGRSAYSIYETCSVFAKGSCLVRGIGGDTSRVSADVSWRRAFIDPLGQVWTPFAGARLDGFWVQPDASGYQNAAIANFIGTDDSLTARAMPTVGIEYRYPFVNATNGFGTHLIEPIAQVIARPSETRIGRLPNEDAQSLVFDDTNLFEWNKFSGYDRVEGGVRANIGAQYTVTADNGAYGNLLFGQSYQIAGVNSFKTADLTNTGLDSGLESQRSDPVGRVQIVPASWLSFTGRGRFDEKDFTLRRMEVQSTATLFEKLSTNVIYARYDAQPDLGSSTRKEGLYGSATYQITPNWNINGGALLDLDRYLTEREQFIASNGTTRYKGSPWKLASLSIGAGYTDECTTLSVTYSSSFQDTSTGTKESAKTLMVRLDLRTLGEAGVTQGFGTAAAQDGVTP